MTLMWLKIGGVGIDTAYGYQNQPQVGAAINAAIKTKIVANRSSVFVTSKINPEHCTEEAALEAVKVDLQQLNVGYIDLVLQHFPCSTASENQAVWRGLTSAKNQGFVRSVGVSHYTVRSAMRKERFDKCKDRASSLSLQTFLLFVVCGEYWE